MKNGSIKTYIYNKNYYKYQPTERGLIIKERRRKINEIIENNKDKLNSLDIRNQQSKFIIDEYKKIYGEDLKSDYLNQFLRRKYGNVNIEVNED